jgi:hypothetical protein
MAPASRGIIVRGLYNYIDTYEAQCKQAAKQQRCCANEECFLRSVSSEIYGKGEGVTGAANERNENTGAFGMPHEGKLEETKWTSNCTLRGNLTRFSISNAGMHPRNLLAFP